MPAPKGNCFNPKGRPFKEVDWKLFEELCSIQCTQEEMSSILHISADALVDAVIRNYNEVYAVVYKRFSAPGKSSLRRDQFKMAKRNASMAIWLGKQYLDQKDNQAPQMATEEIINNYEMMISQLRALQSSKASASIVEQPQEPSSSDSHASAFSSV